jgi:hypothetical protein
MSLWCVPFSWMPRCHFKIALLSNHLNEVNYGLCWGYEDKQSNIPQNNFSLSFNFKRLQTLQLFWQVPVKNKRCSIKLFTTLIHNYVVKLSVIRAKDVEPEISTPSKNNQTPIRLFAISENISVLIRPFAISKNTVFDRGSNADLF